MNVFYLSLSSIKIIHIFNNRLTFLCFLYFLLFNVLFSNIKFFRKLISSLIFFFVFLFFFFFYLFFFYFRLFSSLSFSLLTCFFWFFSKFLLNFISLIFEKILEFESFLFNKSLFLVFYIEKFLLVMYN